MTAKKEMETVVVLPSPPPAPPVLEDARPRIRLLRLTVQPGGESDPPVVPAAQGRLQIAVGFARPRRDGC